MQTRWYTRLGSTIFNHGLLAFWTSCIFLTNNISRYEAGRGVEREEMEIHRKGFGRVAFPRRPILGGGCRRLQGLRESRRSPSRAARRATPWSLDIPPSPEGRKQNSPGLQPWENVPERIALKGRPNDGALLPKITFVESNSMVIQKLTKLFLTRPIKSAQAIFFDKADHVYNQAGKGLRHRTY